MSIVKMKKMSIVAHSSERTKLLRIFVKSGCVELVGSGKELTVTSVDRERRERNEQRKARASFCLAFIKDAVKEIATYDKKLAPKIDLKKENRLVPLEEYEEVCNNAEELFSKIDELEGKNNRVTDLRSEKTRLNSYIDQLKPYDKLDFDMANSADTLFTNVLVGSINTDKKSVLEEKLVDKCVISYGEGDKTTAVAIIAHKEYQEQTLSVLSECDFIKSSFDFRGTAKEKIDETKTRIAEIDEEIKQEILSVADYAKLVPTAKIVYDYYAMELAKLDVTEKSERTKKAIAFVGWVPSDKVDSLTALIAEKCSRYEIEFRDPTDDEVPPTLVKNNKVVGAFSGITDMFGSPNYRESDPNLFVGLFYFLIFGIMLGDAGYGLVMAIACFLFVKLKKPVKKSGQMIIMFGFCGISTFIWGMLFGGWFSIEIAEGSFLDKLRWFSPLDEPLKMFMLSLGVGVVQIGTGFALNGISRIKSGDKNELVKGICSDFGWVVIFIGLLFLFPSLLEYLNAVENIYSWFATTAQIGMYIAIVGFVMILIGGAWGKKNPVKAVGGALGSVYGAINVVSDLLSYSRLFGLGLTTGVIGLVMNELGMIVVNIIGPVGWVFAVIIFVGGHIFNLAINLLGAYVHDSRLQYIEFFGRFYEGSGHAFKPMGYNTKYTYLDN